MKDEEFPIYLKELFNNKIHDPIECLKRATLLTDDAQIRLAIVLSIVSENSMTKVVPQRVKDLILLLQDNCIEFQILDKLSSNEIVYMIERLDAFRRPERFNDLLICIECIHGKECSDYLKGAYEAANSVDIDKVIKDLKK